MLPPIARGLRSVGLTLALLLAAEGLAASRRSPLLGQTRDQILDRLGDPRSAIVTGNREVLLFARERVTLREGVVIDVQTLPAEAPSRPPGAAPALPPAAPAPTPPAPVPAATPAVAVPAQGPVAPIVPIQGYTMPAPAAVPSGLPGAAPISPAPVSAPAPAMVATSPEVPVPDSAAPLPPPEPKLEIRAVRPPGSVVPIGGVDPVALAAAVEAPPAVNPASPPAPLPSIAVAPAKAAPPALPAQTGRSGSSPSAPLPAAQTVVVKAAAPTSWFSFPVLAGAAGAFVALVLLVFRSGGRRRTPSLTSAALSRHAAHAAREVSPGAAQFTAALLRGLEFRRFRDLVAAYYGKTGAVAVPVATGPDDVVHVKIFWKGEARPFACVRCLTAVTAPVPAAPLEQLAGVLAAEDIRRGYVLTSGTFSSDARDLAEEKSMTLLSGDLFAEKLNALPEAARNELMDLVLAEVVDPLPGVHRAGTGSSAGGH